MTLFELVLAFLSGWINAFFNPKNKFNGAIIYWRYVFYNFSGIMYRNKEIIWWYYLSETCSSISISETSFCIFFCSIKWNFLNK